MWISSLHYHVLSTIWCYLDNILLNCYSFIKLAACEKFKCSICWAYVPRRTSLGNELNGSCNISTSCGNDRDVTLSHDWYDTVVGCSLYNIKYISSNLLTLLILFREVLLWIFHEIFPQRKKYVDYILFNFIPHISHSSIFFFFQFLKMSFLLLAK